MRRPSECPECGSRNLYESTASSGGGHAPNYLAGLGGFWVSARFQVIVCQDCGLTRFFAEEEARKRLSGSKKWSRIP